MDSGGDDAEAFARLYSRHSRTVRAYVARRIGSAAAEEVAAEVFVVAWRRWPDANEAGLPWLYATAQHAIANYLRGERRRDRALQHLENAARAMPAEAAEASADRVIAAKALLGLAKGDRDILLAVAWDGLTAGDLAGLLGCSTASAHVRLHRARRRLDAAMRVQNPHPDPTMERAR